MQNVDLMLKVFEASERRRTERRQFMRTAASATIAAGGLSLLAACNDSAPSPAPAPTPTPTPTQAPAALTDVDVFNFALNLEYVEAQFYSYATTGMGLPSSMVSGTGTAGTVTGGRAVVFTDPLVRQYANEITADEVAHVNFIRTTLSTMAVAMPNINIAGDATGAFTALARAAGIVSSTGTFDPYESDENFLLGAFVFEDVGVTAYKGASILISNKTYLEAAAGILAVEAYHAGLLRTVLYNKGIATPSLRTNAGLISDARDSVDGPGDDDQGIVGADASVSNIVPTDNNGLAFSRTASQVLNVVYLTKAATVGGGFFPNGVNGNIKMSAAN